jgi:D-glycero-alpha-D-manno-heptose-7-phosphate kinase
MVSRREDPGLILTRTPLRVSFAGGGTDMPDFYEREPGAVFSTAISRYIYVTVKRHGPVFDESVRVAYSKSESVNQIGEIENDIARECLRFLEVDPPIYISTIGDLPASSGLGGSSSFAVGLLNALHAYRGERVSAGQLAEEASHIEIDVLNEPIGKQDQYAAAFGGLNLFSFKPGGSVAVEPQRLGNGELALLFERVMVFWTGHQRDTRSVLTEQKQNIPAKLDALRRMRDDAYQLQGIVSNGALEMAEVGRILDEGWELKRKLAGSITNEQIDAWYQRATDAGAEGGKLLGAGGGGFLLFIVEPERREAIRRALDGLEEVPISYEVHGSRVLSPTGG